MMILNVLLQWFRRQCFMMILIVFITRLIKGHYDINFCQQYGSGDHASCCSKVGDPETSTLYIHSWLFPKCQKINFFSNIVVLYIKRSAWNHWWTSRNLFCKFWKMPKFWPKNLEKFHFLPFCPFLMFFGNNFHIFQYFAKRTFACSSVIPGASFDV